MSSKHLIQWPHTTTLPATKGGISIDYWNFLTFILEPLSKLAPWVLGSSHKYGHRNAECLGEWVGWKFPLTQMKYVLAFENNTKINKRNWLQKIQIEQVTKLQKNRSLILRLQTPLQLCRPGYTWYLPGNQLILTQTIPLFNPNLLPSFRTPFLTPPPSWKRGKGHAGRPPWEGWGGG